MTEVSPFSLGRDAKDVHRRIETELVEKLRRSERGLLEKMALSCRLLADHNHAPTLAGQLSVRCDDGTFWTTNLAAGFGDSRVSNLVRVDDDLQVVEGSGMANPATRFHLWVYKYRPDIRSIVHTHPPHVSALAITGGRIDVAHMDMMMFYDDIAYLSEWPGVPFANEEGRIISGALGDKNNIILANHGMLTVGRTLEHAVYLAVNLELAARVQGLVNASQRPARPVEPDLARKAYDMATQDMFIDPNVEYWMRLTEKRHPDALS